MGPVTSAVPAYGRRLAALLAIGLLVAALVAVGFAIIKGDTWRLPIVLVAVAATVVGMWYGLSSRGAARWAGALGAVVGITALLVVTLTADYRGLPFVVAVVLMFFSAWAARHALGGTIVLARVRDGHAAPAPSGAPDEPEVGRG